MTNLFENAYFDKAYLTRCGYKALYVGKTSFIHLLIVEGNDKVDGYLEDGSFNINGNEHPLDIVSELNPEISEEEIDKFAYDKYPDYPLSYGEYESCEDLRNAYKEGFKKALEYVGSKR